MKDIERQYTQLFDTEQGQAVLKDLQRIWKDAPASFDLAPLAHLEGQRHVVRYIEAMIKKGSKENPSK